jgi:hypothetical protein
MTITEFLLARIEEDEDAARGARSPRWNSRVAHLDHDLYGLVSRHHPDRVLAECRAKRAIVEWHTNYEGYDEAECCEERWGPIQFQATEDRELSAGVTSSGGLSMRESFATQEYVGCVTLMMLASVYADHPDFREEWRA